MPHIFDIMDLIRIVGLLGIFGIVFLESGVFLIGFFLPGDSLLFAAGFVASQGVLSFPILLGGTILAAILAGYFGYWCGWKAGHKLFERENSFFFKKKYLDETKKFYEKYGNKTIVLAHFIPIVRTLAPIFAGVGEMNFHHFSFWNIVGGIIWPTIIITAGFYLGRLIPGVEKFFLPILLLIIILSVLPGVWEWLKNRKKSS
jgi:membrane-associated protein